MFEGGDLTVQSRFLIVEVLENTYPVKLGVVKVRLYLEVEDTWRHQVGVLWLDHVLDEYTTIDIWVFDLVDLVYQLTNIDIVVEVHWLHGRSVGISYIHVRGIILEIAAIQ